MKAAIAVVFGTSFILILIAFIMVFVALGKTAGTMSVLCARAQGLPPEALTRQQKRSGRAKKHTRDIKDREQRVFGPRGLNVADPEVCNVNVVSMLASAPLTKQLVVARYAEDLSFLVTNSAFEPYLPFTVIYNKGADDIPPDVLSRVQGVVRLPNVGRCDHTYLYHIVRGLETGALANTTIFVPGSCMGVESKMQAMARALKGVQPVGTPLSLYDSFKDFSLTSWKATDKVNASKNPEEVLLPAVPRPFGNWLIKLFGETTARRLRSQVVWGGVFFATAAVLRQRPLSFYESLLDEVATHSNPEVGHYIERLWGWLAHGQWVQ